MAVKAWKRSSVAAGNRLTDDRKSLIERYMIEEAEAQARAQRAAEEQARRAAEEQAKQAAAAEEARRAAEEQAKQASSEPFEGAQTIASVGMGSPHASAPPRRRGLALAASLRYSDRTPYRAARGAAQFFAIVAVSSAIGWLIGHI